MRKCVRNVLELNAVSVLAGKCRIFHLKCFFTEYSLLIISDICLGIRAIIYCIIISRLFIRHFIKKLLTSENR